MHVWVKLQLTFAKQLPGVCLHSKKSSGAHIGNWFVHVREQTVSKFVYLEFHIWKLLGNELNFQTVSNFCILLMHTLAYPLHTNLLLWKLFAHYLQTLCLPCNLFIAITIYIFIVTTNFCLNIMNTIVHIHAICY